MTADLDAMSIRYTGDSLDALDSGKRKCECDKRTRKNENLPEFIALAVVEFSCYQ